MTVPVQTTYNEATLTAINTELLAQIEAEGTSGCSIVLKDADDAVLATIPLADPPGQIEEDGILTLNPDGEDPSALEGTVAYAEVWDADDNWVVKVPAVESVSAVYGKVALNSLLILEGSTVSLVSFSIGV